MPEMLQAFVDMIIIFYNFVVENLIPATAADINLIHVAIWLPIIVGLVSTVVAMIKGFWGGRSRRRA